MYGGNGQFGKVVDNLNFISETSMVTIQFDGVNRKVLKSTTRWGKKLLG